MKPSFLTPTIFYSPINLANIIASEDIKEFTEPDFYAV